jgi:hypothetical protein
MLMFMIFMFGCIYLICRFDIPIEKIGVKRILKGFVVLIIMYFVVYVITDIYSLIWFWFM